MSSRVSVCVPVLKRYDLLRPLLVSLQAGTLVPDTIYIIDNGGDKRRLAEALPSASWRVVRAGPSRPMGVAESWNWFLANVPEERVITNDDVVFGPTTLARMVETPGDFVTTLRGNAFSCFLLRDTLVQRIGVFDESISPGYAYFEDCDYEERMTALGIPITHVDDTGAEHVRSATIAALSQAELHEHHWKFVLAQENFIRKWRRMPRGMEGQRVRLKVREAVPAAGSDDVHQEASPALER